MKNLMSFLLCCFASVLIACGSNTGYTLNVKLSGIPDGTSVGLIPSGTHATEKPVAIVPLKDGKVTFTGEVEGPRYFNIAVRGSNGNIGIFLDKGYNVDVTAKATKTEDDEGTSYRYSDVIIKGSPLTDEYKEKMSFRDSFSQLHNAYLERGAEILEVINKARAAGDRQKVDELRETDAYKNVVKEEGEFFSFVGQESEKAILLNKDTWWGPFMMLNTMTYFSEEQQPLFEQFSEEAQNSYYGQIVRDELYPESLVGKPMPDFT